MRENTLVNTSINTPNAYTTKILHQPGDIVFAVTKLHVLGHGIKRGVPESEHYWRVLGSILGKQHILGIYCPLGELVGAVSFFPEAVEDCHYVEKVLFTDFFVVEPGHPAAALGLFRKLHEVARSFGAGRLAISRGESENTYRTTYHKVHKA